MKRQLLRHFKMINKSIKKRKNAFAGHTTNTFNEQIEQSPHYEILMTSSHDSSSS